MQTLSVPLLSAMQAVPVVQTWVAQVPAQSTVPPQQLRQYASWYVPTQTPQPAQYNDASQRSPIPPVASHIPLALQMSTAGQLFADVHWADGQTVLFGAHTPASFGSR